MILSGCATAPATHNATAMTLSYPARRVPAALQTTAKRFAPRLADSYVRVTILAVTGMGDDNPAESRLAPVNAASGTVIARGYVLTAAHIAVRPGNRARITTRDGLVHIGRVMRVDRNRELALIVAPGLGARAHTRLATGKPPAPGATVLGIGTPNGKPGVVTAGTVRRSVRPRPIRYADFSYTHAIELRLRAEPGDSGGPLFNVQGELVGMIASFAINRAGGELSAERATTYAVPAADIARYLDTVLGPR